MPNNLARFSAAVAMFIVAAIAARFGSTMPLALLAFPALFAAIGIGFAARRWPAAMAGVAVFALLIAGTKFRMRDPLASVFGELDWQVMLELGLFAAVGVVVLCIAPLAQWRKQPLSTDEKMLTAYAALAVLSTAWSSTRELTMVRGVQLLVLLGFALVIPRVIGSHRTLRAVMAALLVYCVSAAVLAKLFIFAKGTQVDFAGFHRFTWFAVHPIDAATLVAVAIIFVLAGLFFAPRPWRLTILGVPSWTYLVPLVPVLIVTNSRGPLFALAAGVGLLFVRRYVRLSGLGALVSVGLAIAIMLASYGQSATSMIDSLNSNGGALSRVVLRGQNADEFASLTGRAELWTSAAEIFEQSPVIGVGYQGSRPLLLEAASWAAYAHDALLQTLVDLGIVGALLLCIPIIRLLFSGSLTDDTVDPVVLWDRGLTFGLAVFILVNSFSNESFAAAPTFQTLLPLLCVAVGAQTRARPMRVPGALLLPSPRTAMQGARS